MGIISEVRLFHTLKKGVLKKGRKTGQTVILIS